MTDTTINPTAPARFITRTEAELKPPLRPAVSWPAGCPAGVVLHHGGVFYDLTKRGASDPAAIVRSAQQFHTKTKGYSDIEYGLMVVPTPDGDAVIVEARGLDWVVISNGNRELNYSYGSVCVVGDYRLPIEVENGVKLNALTPRLIEVTQQAIDLYTARHDTIRSVFDHNTARRLAGLYGTACPGGQIMAALTSGALAAVRPPSEPTPPDPGTSEPGPEPGGLPAGVELPTLTVGWEDHAANGPCAKVQAFLNATAGQGLLVDGRYGARTAQAVRDWQENISRQFTGHPYTGAESGVVGPETWGAIALVSDALAYDFDASAFRG